MATYHGKNGVVSVGAIAIAEVQEFSVTEQVTTVDDTAMGDTDETHLVGVNSWNGTIKCSWDPTDTNGQEALSIGASVTLNLYPAGTSAGQRRLSGTATVTEIVRTVSRSTVNERTVNIKGNGALAKATI